MHYGLVAGSVLLVAFISTIIRKLRSIKKNSIQQNLLIMIIIYATLYSMVSSTYLSNTILWLLFGLSLSGNNEYKNNKVRLSFAV